MPKFAYENKRVKQHNSYKLVTAIIEKYLSLSIVRKYACGQLYLEPLLDLMLALPQDHFTQVH